MRIYGCFGCGEKKKEFLKPTGPEPKSVPPKPGIPERFRAKWKPVRQNRRLEPGFDSMRHE
jgi:hypothetical protein